MLQDKRRLVEYTSSQYSCRCDTCTAHTPDGSPLCRAFEAVAAVVAKAVSEGTITASAAKYWWCCRLMQRRIMVEPLRIHDLFGLYRQHLVEEATVKRLSIGAADVIRKMPPHPARGEERASATPLPIRLNASYEFRDYQKRALKAVVESLVRKRKLDASTPPQQRGRNPIAGGLLMVPAGGGKTLVASSIVGLCCSQNLRVAILMQSSELIPQFVVELFEHFAVAQSDGDDAVPLRDALRARADRGEGHLIGTIMNVAKAVALGEDLTRHIQIIGSSLGSGAAASHSSSIIGRDVQILFVSAKTMHHGDDALRDSILGWAEAIVADEAWSFAPGNMVETAFMDIASPNLQLAIGLSAGYARRDGNERHLGELVKWSPEVVAAGGILYSEPFYSVARVNLTLQKWRVAQPEDCSRFVAMRRLAASKAHANKAHANFVEWLGWQLEPARVEAVMALVGQLRSQQRTTMVFFEHCAALYAYADAMIGSASPGSDHIVVVTGNPATDRRRVLEMLAGRSDTTASSAKEILAQCVPASHHDLSFRARDAKKAGRPLIILTTNVLGVGTNIPDVDTTVHVACSRAQIQWLQQADGRANRALEGVPEKTSLAIHVYSTRKKFMVLSHKTEAQLERDFIKDVWAGLRECFGGARGKCLEQCQDVCHFPTKWQEDRGLGHIFATAPSAAAPAGVTDADSWIERFRRCELQIYKTAFE